VHKVEGLLNKNYLCFTSPRLIRW